MRPLVVINPSSRDFEAQARWPSMKARLQKAGPLQVVETVPDDAESRRLVAAALTEGCDRVVAIGGDGTVHMVVDVLMRTIHEGRPTLAVIPFGTANDVAKSFDLPLGAESELADIAIGDCTARLDVAEVVAQVAGEARRTHWVDSVTVGMDADILLARGRYRSLGGYTAYLAALAERSVQQKGLDVQVTVDGEVMNTRVFNIVVNNVPLYAGALRLPDAAADDGLLDVYLFNRRQYVSKVMSFAMKQLDVLELGVADLLEDITDNQRRTHGRSVALRLATPRQVQVDGEVFCEAEDLRCEVVGHLDVAVAGPGS